MLEGAPGYGPRAEGTHRVPKTVAGNVTAADFAVGDRVITMSTVRPARFADRSGTIVSLNVRDDEIGLWLGNYGPDGHRSVIWFRPREVAVADTATTARQAPVLPSSVALSTDLAEQAL
jgi:hypothetical protein